MKKNLWMFALLLLIAVACDRSQENNVIPSGNQKFLGMVLHPPAQNDGGLILLKDGRTISPVSGFNPTSAEVGSKFLISFESLTSASSEILKVRVTDFTSAKDSTFIPPPGKDSTITKIVLAGTYVGRFTYFKINPYHPKDTSKITPSDTVRITFKGKNYDSPQSSRYFPAGGAGTFLLDSAKAQTIHFNNTKIFPISVSPDLILNGQYNCQVIGNDLTLWKYNVKNNTISKYFLRKKK
jgi:hypothetical protein